MAIILRVSLMNNDDLLESYRNLVWALIAHSALHEGTDIAIADVCDYAEGGDQLRACFDAIHKLRETDRVLNEPT